MFGREKTLFHLFGIPVKASLSWLFLVGLVLFTLSEGLFPSEQLGIGPGRPWYVYWGMGLAGTIGLFASLIAHELCHSLVAQHTGMPVGGITLFIFGGVSELQDEPPTALSEFFMAVVGPASSVLIGLVMLLVWLAGNSFGWPRGLQSVLQYIWYINFLLAAFNSLPAFPLDGGRVVRSILWGLSDDLRTATNIAAKVGSFFGFGLILLGIFALFQAAVIPGLWAMVLGFFLRQAAQNSLRMVIMRQHLEGERIRNFMTTDMITVPRDVDLQEFVNSYVFHHRFDYYPVVDEEGTVQGIVNARAPRDVPREDWTQTTVEQLQTPLDEIMVLEPEADAVEALALLRNRDESQAIVVEDGEPVGTITLRDLLQFLALKIDLEPRGMRR